MSRLRLLRRHSSALPAEHLVDRMVRNVEHGRFERSLSGLTAASALVTGVEIYLEHYKASFGDKWMWSPVLLTPPLVVAGIGGVFSRRWAKTALPVAAALYTVERVAGGVLPRARSGPQARRLAAVVVQPADGPADLRARVDGDGGRDGSARRGPASGEVMPEARSIARRSTWARATTCRSSAPAAGRRIRTGCPASAGGPRPQMIGRYPDFDVLESSGTWDEATRKVVLARLDPPGPLRFFTAEEEPTLRAFCDTVAGPGRASRGCRWPRRSTTSWPPGGSTATSTPTCPTTATPGGWCCAASTTPRSQAYRCAFADCTAEQRENDRRRVRAGTAGRRPVGRAERHARVVGGDARRAGRVLLPPVGVERDRLRRSGLPARVHAARRPANGRGRRARAVRATAARTDGDPVRGRDASMGDLLRGRAQGRGRSARQRLPVPARRALPRPARRGDHAPLRRRRRGRPGDRRRRRGRLGAGAAAGPARAGGS